MPKTSSAEAARLAQAAAIAEAAYFRAERRHFQPGFEIDDWLAAEREILGAAGPRKPAQVRKRAAETGAAKEPAESKPKQTKSKTTKKKTTAKPGG
jgi:Protein of unknown function (DUF2934)